MDTEIEEVDDADAATPLLNKKEDLPAPSYCKLIGLNAYVFAYGMIVATMGLIVLPVESIRLYEEDHALFLGLLLASTGITQLISPVTGYYSDRCQSPYGRRRPYMVFGVLLSLIGLSGMFLSRQYLSAGWYIVTLVVATLGMNITYSAYTALMPDFVSAAHLGKGSGTMAIMGMGGSLVGFILFGYILDAYWSYAVYMFVICSSMLVTWAVANEKQLVTARPVLGSEIAKSYWIDRSTHSDFFWVFVCRTVYYIGVSVQAFMLLYLRDIVMVDSPIHFTSVVALTGQLSASIVALPAGKLSDRIGRKGLVRVSCCIMGSVYVLFMYFTKPFQVLLLSFLYGFGNGTFIAVDYALAVDTLPSQENAGRDLGVWGIAAFLGTTLGPCMYGPLLNYIGSGPDPDHYTPVGYLVIMSLACSWLLLVVLLLVMVKKAK